MTKNAIDGDNPAPVLRITRVANGWLVTPDCHSHMMNQPFVHGDSYVAETPEALNRILGRWAGAQLRQEAAAKDQVQIGTFTNVGPGQPARPAT